MTGLTYVRPLDRPLIAAVYGELTPATQRIVSPECVEAVIDAFIRAGASEATRTRLAAQSLSSRVHELEKAPRGLLTGAKAGELAGYNLAIGDVVALLQELGL